ncbi:MULTISPECIES: amidohydrolase/deacetylase family metallohydrolase [unclassified Brevibacterium]|uniref:amidohydrolase/deacetylase family metallohydrolase n=1 Tax=unclassified Brevibacterium TaxID=2614124 RepID=UPI001866A338|nr:MULTISPECIES: amidohydrolase/deacetylase family metallohydrolase [unclassified Brevibacterium]
MHPSEDHQTTPIRIIDDGTKSWVGALNVSASCARLVGSNEHAAAAARLAISPGWADLHTHVFDGSTQISVSPDSVGLDHGVHLVADAGSAGQATVDGFERYVTPSAKTKVVSWLNIGSGGLVNLRETADISLIDIDASVKAVINSPTFIRGIKVRSSGMIVGNMGLLPLQMGRTVARECHVPLMVHIGEVPPVIDDVLDLLDDGDVITHCYHGKVGTPWSPDGTPLPALRRAIERGVKLDVGHGAASFDFGIARRAVEAGFPPDSISTDIHVRNVNGPVHSLASVMTKLLACGMAIDDIIRAVTDSPRSILSLDEPWLNPDDTIRHATVFELADGFRGNENYIDSKGNAVTPDVHIVPRAVIVDGKYSQLPII